MITTYFDYFSKLHCSVVHGLVAPHKAVLILSIFELCEYSPFASDRIFYSDDLIDAFSYTWKRYLGDIPTFRCDSRQPFWNMKSEPFWTLYHVNGEIVQSDEKMPSEKSLKNEYYGVLTKDISVLIQDSAKRSFMRTALIALFIAPICFALNKEYKQFSQNTSKGKDIKNERSRAFPTILRITRKDGGVIAKNKAVDTFVQAIKEVGIDDSRTVLPQLFVREPGKQRILLEPGLYLNTCNNTNDKKKYLEKLSDKLGLDWVIDIAKIYKVKSQN